MKGYSCIVTAVKSLTRFQQFCAKHRNDILNIMDFDLQFSVCIYLLVKIKLILCITFHIMWTFVDLFTSDRSFSSMFFC